jgi:hypothetical protein
VLASTPDLETLVYVDTTDAGSVFDLNSDEYCGTSGDDELDWLVGDVIQKAIASRNTYQQLDDVDRQRWGRVQRPADRRWSA